LSLIHLPEAWPRRVRSAVVHVVAMARVWPAAHPPAFRRRREVRQHRGRREVHPVHEEGVHAGDPGRAPRRRLPPRTGGVRALVQRGAAALLPARCHSGRGVLQEDAGLPEATPGAANAMAARIAVRLSTGARARTARCHGDRSRRPARPRALAPADRDAPPRCVGLQ